MIFDIDKKHGLALADAAGQSVTYEEMISCAHQLGGNRCSQTGRISIGRE